MNLKNYLKESADSEKIAICKRRLKDHIERVKYFYSVMMDEGFIPESELNWKEVSEHDSDKLKTENLKRQALRFSDNTLSEKDLKEVDDVVREHIKSSKHHCEYWGNGDHNTVGMNCTKMPDKYIYEMMADWFSTSEEKGTKVEDWYDKYVGSRWNFNEHQKELMLKCIAFLNKYYDKSKKRSYGLKYIDPARIK